MEINMKISVLITELVEHLARFGDGIVKVDILTENQSNILDITDTFSDFKQFDITCDVEDIKGFKKSFK
jgi:hypothetical protein